MSINKTGAKTFLRAAPMPWVDVTVLSGEDGEDGASIHVRFHDDGSETNLPLSAENAASLAAVCGGEEEVAGSGIRYRLLPDDSLEFQRAAA